jgi:hypothetical protein
MPRSSPYRRTNRATEHAPPLNGLDPTVRTALDHRWVQGEDTRFKCGDNVFHHRGQERIDRQLEKAGAQFDGSRNPDL